MRKIVFVGIALLAAPLGARAQSLWDRRDPYAAFLYVDCRARNVGDLVTIVVEENTDIDHEEQRTNDKETDTNGVFTLQGLMSGNKTSSQANASLNGETTSKRQLNTTANYISGHKFEDRITVTVMQVLPNGNLVVEGYRKRIVSGEDRTLRVSGIVRPQDIGSGNMVLSQFVANFEVKYTGKGEETAFGRQGWFGKLMNKAWPF